MKHFNLSSDILPLGEFKTQISRVLRQMKETGRPVVITQNGRPAAVMVSPQDFDLFVEQERFLAAVRQGLEDVEAGRTIDDQQMERELDREFGAGQTS